MSRATPFARLALGAAASFVPASGAIVVFDISPDVLGPLDGSYGGVHVGALNFSNGSFAPGNSSFTLESDYYFVNFIGGAVRTAVNSNNSMSETRFSLFSANDIIGSSTAFSADSLAINRTNELSLGTLYLALKLTDGQSVHYGWFEITTAPVGYENSNRQITYTRFAFNDVAGQSILAGQTAPVPEASTLGMVGGLFGLVAAAHVRRRRVQQAAASDRFLALAAGEKLN